MIALKSNKSTYEQYQNVYCLVRHVTLSRHVHQDTKVDAETTTANDRSKVNKRYEAVQQYANNWYKRYQPKFLDLVSKYEDYSGLTEVKMCQDRVINVQQQLLTIQEERREINEAIMTLQEERTRIQEEINKLAKGQPEWFELIKKEYALNKERESLSTRLKMVERDERDCFTNLSNAVRDSHEKQRWQSDRTKYWGLILGVASSLITLMFSNLRYRQMLHELVDKITSSERVEVLIDELKIVSKDLDRITRTNLKSLKTLNDFDEMIMGLNKTLNEHNTNVTNTLTKFEVLVNSLNRTQVATFKNIDKLMESNKDELLGFFQKKKFLNIGDADFDADANRFHLQSLGVGFLSCLVLVALARMFN